MRTLRIEPWAELRRVVDVKSLEKIAPIQGERAFVVAALEGARAFHAALARPAATPCPVPVLALGGDCLLTLARAVAGEGPPGSPPRLEARTRREQDLLYEAGDGRVTSSRNTSTRVRST